MLKMQWLEEEPEQDPESSEPQDGEVDQGEDRMNGKDTALFSKASDEWSTPQWLFDVLDQEFHFECDAAATPQNSKCCEYIGKSTGLTIDGISDSWTLIWEKDRPKIFWLNAPYSKISAFMKKAYEESLKGATVVCLIPCRSDTRYWHDYVMKSQEIRFVKGRLKFGNSKTGAPFPSVVVIFEYKRIGLEEYPVIGKTIEQKKKVTESSGP